jgi:hypothetical protein
VEVEVAHCEVKALGAHGALRAYFPSTSHISGMVREESAGLALAGCMLNPVQQPARFPTSALCQGAERRDVYTKASGNRPQRIGPATYPSPPPKRSTGLHPNPESEDRAFAVVSRQPWLPPLASTNRPIVALVYFAQMGELTVAGKLDHLLEHPTLVVFRKCLDGLEHFRLELVIRSVGT